MSQTVSLSLPSSSALLPVKQLTSFEHLATAHPSSSSWHPIQPTPTTTSPTSKGGRPSTTLIALFILIGIVFLLGSLWAASVFRSKLRPPASPEPSSQEHTLVRPKRARRPVLTEQMFDMLQVRKAGGSVTEECAICLNAVRKTEVVVVLPCGHGFHRECVKVWLTRRSEVCPLCKRSVRVALGIPEEVEEVVVTPVGSMD